MQHRPINVTGQGSQPGVELYRVAAAVLSRLKVGGLEAVEAAGRGVLERVKGTTQDATHYKTCCKVTEVIPGQSLCHITQHVDATVQEMDTIAQCNQYLCDVFVCGLRTNMFGGIQKGLHTGFSATVRVCAVQGTLSR